MTEPETTDGLYVITIMGRDIKVKKLTELQFMLMAREAKVSTRAGVEPDRIMVAAERLLNMTMSVIPDSDDREYVEGLAMVGMINTSDLLSLIRGATEEAVPTKPAVRRGRPRKKAF